tara:strand:+ start:63 stop:842 length:780 start_codon:yes stop_codon:yes gene_type:complete
MDLTQEIIIGVPGISDSEFITLCIASFFTSVISASFGLGGGLMLVTIMASILPPLAVIPIHGVIQFSSNLSRAMMMWNHIKFTWIMPFVIGTLFGAYIGGQIVFAIPKHLLQGIIGLFILYSLWGPSMRGINSSWATFAGIGAFASFTTMFVGGTGPLVAPFIRSTTYERRMTVATHAAFMSWQHGIKILTFGLLGFAFSTYAPLVIVMILLSILGSWFGKTFLTWMPEKVFRLAFNTVLTLLAIRLLYVALNHGKWFP